MNPLSTTPAQETQTPAQPTRQPPQTLGEMVLDAAARHSGIALQFTRNGQPA